MPHRLTRQRDVDLSGLKQVPGIVHQAGALAWLPDTDPIRIVLVTSRRTGRWVFPKGGIDPGMTAPRTAAQEALEEAGVEGEPAPEPIGSYRTLKIRPPQVWTIEVALYPVRVERILDVWDESDRRVRRFATLEEARALLADASMSRLAESFLQRGQ